MGFWIGREKQKPADGTTGAPGGIFGLDHRAKAHASENFWLLATVLFSFVFGKNCLIIDYLGLKDLFRQLRANCAISYSFYLYLMLYACVARFDVTENLKKIWILCGPKQ